jgi:hypothetical protein
MQLRTVPIVSALDEELDEEAEWIYDSTFRKQERPETADQQKQKVLDSNANPPTATGILKVTTYVLVRPE